MRRNKPAQGDVSDEFRDDVLEYGGMLYESLRRRRDFDTAGDQPRAREVRYQKRTSCDD